MLRVFEKLCEPISWHMYFLLYFFIAALDTMIWPMIWCHQTLPIFGGFHVMIEALGVLRLLFNSSKYLQPFWFILFITYTIFACVLKYDDALTLFQISFIVTDTASLTIGGFIYFYNRIFVDITTIPSSPKDNSICFEGPERIVASNIGAIFAIHGVVTSILPPLLLSTYIFESDLLAPFIIIFLGGIAQLFIVYPFFTHDDHSDQIQNNFKIQINGWTNKSKFIAISIWSFFIALLIIVYNLFQQKNDLPCGTHQTTILIGQIIWPFQGVIALGIVAFFIRNYQMLHDKQKHDKNGSLDKKRNFNDHDIKINGTQTKKIILDMNNITIDIKK